MPQGTPWAFRSPTCLQLGLRPQAGATPGGRLQESGTLGPCGGGAGVGARWQKAGQDGSPASRSCRAQPSSKEAGGSRGQGLTVGLCGGWIDVRWNKLAPRVIGKGSS